MWKIVNETVTIKYYKHVEKFRCSLFEHIKTNKFEPDQTIGGTLKGTLKKIYSFLYSNNYHFNNTTTLQK